MFDGLLTGIISGQIFPLAVRHLRRFRLVMIFVSCVVMTPFTFFIIDAYESGLTIAINRILSKKFFGVLLTGAALGALAVFAVWACAKIAPHESANDRRKGR